MFFVAPEDAHNLYRRLHETKVGVLAMGQTSVCIEPRSSTVPKLALWQFVQYKAHWMGTIGLESEQGGRPKRATPDRSTLDDLEGWLWPPQCDGPTDARILPLFVFLEATREGDLNAKPERVQFNGRYGTRTRTDPRQRHWRQADHFHPPLRLESLAPCGIPDGFHWDVARSRHSTHEIANTTEVWRIAEKGYANVFPNAFIRGSKPHARRIWP